MLIKNNKLYDQLKKFALVWLPAIGTLYFALAQIWGLPNADEVVGSIVAFDTFLGVTLHISNTQYNNPENAEGKYDGTMTVTETDDKILHSLDLNSDPEQLQGKDELRLKVEKAVKKKRRRPAKKAVEGTNGF